MATLEQAEKLISIFKGVSTEKMQAILASGLIADIRDCDVGKVDREDFKKYIGLSNILEFLGIVNIPVRAREFVFKYDKDCSDDEVQERISFLFNNDYERWFSLDKIKKPFTGFTLSRFRLKKIEGDDSIIKEIGEEKAEITLAEMFFLMEMQGNGKSGVLSTNGRMNIFYIRDRSGVLRAVCCRWDSENWEVYAFSFDHPSFWRVGDQVFSRNSSES